MRTRARGTLIAACRIDKRQLYAWQNEAKIVNVFKTRVQLGERHLVLSADRCVPARSRQRIARLTRRSAVPYRHQGYTAANDALKLASPMERYRGVAQFEESSRYLSPTNAASKYRGVPFVQHVAGNKRP
jgi:hypothetical protein